MEVKENYYGEPPIDLGEYKIPVTESMFYLYLPIKMRESVDVRIPERLKQFTHLINRVEEACSAFNRAEDYQRNWRDRYVYLTVKHMLVNPGFWGNRGGAHCDGFGTDDMNWIWYDKNPTEFNVKEFQDITSDERLSLKQFEGQWDHKSIVTFPPFHLLELNPFVVHRVAAVTRYDMRTFVKISTSKHQFNLIGNSHNYLFDYNWKMFDRQEVRNMTTYGNSDYVPADVA